MQLATPDAHVAVVTFSGTISDDLSGPARWVLETKADNSTSWQQGGSSTTPTSAAGGRAASRRDAPWLADDEITVMAQGSGVYAIAIPPQTPEEHAADADARRQFELRSRRGEVRRTYLPEALHRHDGLSIVAC